METHVRILAVLLILMGLFSALAGLFALVVFGGIGGLADAVAGETGSALAGPVLGAVGAGLFMFLLAVALPGIVAGAGLLRFRPWARTFTIVLSALNLFNFPVGTALGLYGMWVLLAIETEPLFRRRAGG